MPRFNNRHLKVAWQTRFEAVLLFPIILVFGLIGCKESIYHDEVLAGRRAVEFVEIAFVKQDIEAGYARLSVTAKRYVSLDNFKETVSRLHPKAYPLTVTAIEYEPIPAEERAIYIFLVGENAGERFYYRLTMEGTAASDYKISIIDRGFRRYPASPLRRAWQNKDKNQKRQ